MKFSEKLFHKPSFLSAPEEVFLSNKNNTDALNNQAKSKAQVN